MTAPFAGDDQRAWHLGEVVGVHDDWHVDVRLVYASSAVLRRVKVLGEYLPEVHTPERQSRVVVGRLAGWQQGPVALPVHHTIAKDDDRRGFVYWSEHLRYRITIQDGELEIRNATGDALLRLRVIEDGQVIRLDVPSCRLVLKGDTGEVELYGETKVSVVSDGQVDVQAPLVTVAANLAQVTAEGAVTISAPTISLTADASVTLTAPVVAINP